MNDRRSIAPVQTDPIRDRLGVAAAARDVRCPNCGVLYKTARRWQMRCPDCGHDWTDRSNRTLVDKLRDVRLEFFATLIMATAAFLAAGTLLVWVSWLLAEAADLRGWDRVYGLAVLFAASFLSLIVLGRLFRH